jgi:hypothetical protein
MDEASQLAVEWVRAFRLEPWRGELAGLVIDQGLSPRMLRSDALRGLDRRALREEALDLVVHSVILATSDHYLTRDEVWAIKAMRTAFGVTGKKLLRERRERVEDVIQSVMIRIMADGEVSRGEMYLRDRLQEALGISYDEFVEVYVSIAKTVVMGYVVGLGRGNNLLRPEDVPAVEAQLRKLATVMKLEFTDT